MRTWEYKLEVYDGVESVAVLNQLGQQGWELCGVRVSRRRRSSRFFYLKRPKEEKGVYATRKAWSTCFKNSGGSHRYASRNLASLQGRLLPGPGNSLPF